MKTPEEIIAGINTNWSLRSRTGFVGSIHGPMIIKALDAAGYVIVPKEPTLGLLVSMALRFNHGFGLESEKSQLVQIGQMKQIYEEIIGSGFFSPEKESEYCSMLGAARNDESRHPEG